MQQPFLMLCNLPLQCKTVVNHTIHMKGFLSGKHHVFACSRSDSPSVQDSLDQNLHWIKDKRNWLCVQMCAREVAAKCIPARVHITRQNLHVFAGAHQGQHVRFSYQPAGRQHAIQCQVLEQGLLPMRLKQVLPC